MHLAGSDWLCFSALSLTKAQHEVLQPVTGVDQDTQQKQPSFLASTSVCGFHARCCNLENRSRLSTAEQYQAFGIFRGHLTAVSSTQYPTHRQAQQKCCAKQDIEHSDEDLKHKPSDPVRQRDPQAGGLLCIFKGQTSSPPTLLAGIASHCANGRVLMFRSHFLGSASVAHPLHSSSSLTNCSRCPSLPAVCYRGKREPSILHRFDEFVLQLPCCAFSR